MNPILLAQIIQKVLGTGAAVAPLIAEATTKGRKLENREFKDLVKRAKQNQYGLSEAQKRQMASSTTEDVLAQQRAATAETARALAANPTSGSVQQQMAAQQATNLGVAQAAARGQAEEASRQVGEQQKARLRELADKRTERAKANTAVVAGALAGQKPASEKKEGEEGSSSSGGTGGGGINIDPSMIEGVAKMFSKSFVK